MHDMYFDYFWVFMLDAKETHLGRNFPSLFGSHPIHLIFSMLTPCSGNKIVNMTLDSKDTDFFTRMDNTLIVLFFSLGLQFTFK